jgi:hypothetical protein
MGMAADAPYGKNQTDRMLSGAGLVSTPSKGVKPGAGWRG